MAPPPLPDLPSVAGTVALTFTSGGQAAASPSSSPSDTSARDTIEQLESEPAASNHDEGHLGAIPGGTGTWAPTRTFHVEGVGFQMQQPGGYPQQAPGPTGYPPQPGYAQPAPVPAVGAAPSVLRAGTSPGFITFYAGPSRTIHGPSLNFANLPTLKIEQSIGGHFLGASDGPALAFVLQQNFGLVNAFTFGGRFQYDVAVDSRYGAYITPHITLGFRLLKPADVGYLSYYSYFGYYGGDTEKQFSLQLGLEAKVLLADKLLLTFRPVNLEMTAPNPGGGDAKALLAWDVLAGIGVTF